jgi:antitoxin YefM
MRTVPLSEAKDKLSGLIDTVEREHEIIQITRHGHSAAVLISQDDLDSLHETLFWLSQKGIREDVAEAFEAVENGGTLNAAEVRARFGLPNQ